MPSIYCEIAVMMYFCQFMMNHKMEPAFVSRRCKLLIFCLLLTYLLVVVKSFTTCPCPPSCKCDCLRYRIDCKKAFLTDVPQTASTFPMVRLYQLNFNRISRIEDEAFANMSSLQDIQLSYNVISVIEPFAFIGLWHLIYLSLDYNRITDVSPIHSMPSLTKLYLRSNQITSISTEDFHLINGNIRSSLLIDLSSNHLYGLSDLSVGARKISIQEGGLTVFDLQKAKFANVFQEINMKNNFIRILPDLRNMTSLRSLSLINNPLMKIKSAFPASLRILSLSKTLVHKFPRTLMQGSLISLNLNENFVQNLRDIVREEVSMGGAMPQRLYLSKNQIQDATLVSKMNSMLRLDLSYNKLSGTFVYNSFKLPHLQTLNLRGNSITELTFFNDVLNKHDKWYGSHYSNLTDLDVCENNISNLTFLSFFPKLTSLHACSNNLITIDDMCKGLNLKYITLINFNGNGLSNLECFNNLTRLTTVSLSDNRINTINSSAFLESPVRTLDLAGNELIEFPFLSPAHFLEHITVNRNKIQHVSSVILQAYPNLRSVYLSDNILTVVHITSMSLRYLDLSGNILKMNKSMSLQSLPKLNTLILSKIQLVTFDNSIFEGKKCMTFTLDVSGNCVTDGSTLVPSPNAQRNLSHRILYARNNKIRTLPSYFFDGFNGEVDISGNLLYSISGKQCSNNDCIQKEHIDISNNRLHYISSTAFKDCPCIGHLNVSKNPISDGLWIKFIPSLISLDVSFTAIELEIPLANKSFLSLHMNGMEHHPALRTYNFTCVHYSPNYEFSMQRNNLVSFPALTSRFLNIVNVGHNQVREITHDSLQLLWSLRKLILHHNRIRRIPSHCFDSCPHIYHIDLSNNLIQFISESAFDGLSGANINLADNRLVSISPRSLPSFSHALDLRKNPWHCNQELEDLRQWLIQSNLDTVECHAPPRLFGRSLIDLDSDELNNTLQVKTFDVVCEGMGDRDLNTSNLTQTGKVICDSVSWSDAFLQLANPSLSVTLFLSYFAVLEWVL